MTPENGTGLGVEYNESNYKECLRQGLPVCRGDFLHAELEGLFDVIVMFEYIEHSEKPSVDIHKCWDLLKPAGIFLVETGNADSSKARTMGARWAYFEAAPDHRTFFSDATLSSVLRNAGFKSIVFHGQKEAEVMLLIARKT